MSLKRGWAPLEAQLLGTSQRHPHLSTHKHVMGKLHPSTHPCETSSSIVSIRTRVDLGPSWRSHIELGTRRLQANAGAS